MQISIVPDGDSMSSTQERADRRREDDEAAARDARLQQETDRREAVIAAGLMRVLGRPADFLRTTARLLWGSCYRVNVFVGPHVASARIAHSFFVEANGDGKILTCRPPLTKAY
jgi:hypothetical protein